MTRKQTKRRRSVGILNETIYGDVMTTLREQLKAKIERDAEEYSKRSFEIWKRGVERTQDPTYPIMSDVEHYKACGKSFIDLVVKLDELFEYIIDTPETSRDFYESFKKSIRAAREAREELKRWVES